MARIRQVGKRAWLMRDLRQRYEHPEEVRAYASQVTGGLLPEEETVLSRLLPHPCRIADIGSGAGREAFALMAKGHRVVALDISQAMLRRALELAEERGVSLACVWMQDPLRLPLPKAAFDCALALAQLLSHIPGSAARVALLKEVRRVLVPGGLLVASVTDRIAAADLCGDAREEGLSPLERAVGWEEGDIWVWQPSDAKLESPLFFHLHERDEVQEELEAAGLEMLEYLPQDGLHPDAAPDAYRYRFVVARR